MRVFISIELPEKAKQEIVRIQNEIEKLGLIKGKFIEKENLHLTLKFLGEIDDKKLEKIKEKLNELKFSKFKVRFDKLGVFSEKFVRIVWISLKGDELFELQKDVDEVLKDFFGKEQRFMAHVTIVRPKFVKNREKFIEELGKIDFEKVEFEVDKIFLKKSELFKEGAKYFELKEIEGYR